MLSSKFSSPSPKSSAVFIRSKSVSHENKIVEKTMADGQSLSDAITYYCDFTVQEDGYYSVATQLCLKNSSAKAIACEYLQMGVCSGADFESNFNSQIINSKALPDYVIAQNLSTTMYLKADEKYHAWLNFASAKNEAFLYVKELSHLRLYHLSA